jgi:hypothetical protein
MSEVGSSVQEAAAADLPPGVAPAFGSVPEAPFEHIPERLVLSSEAHSRLAPGTPFSLLNGAFTLERVGSGTLSLRETEAPGELHVHADVHTLGGPLVRLDARVRESWVMRQASGDAAPANVRVVNELIRIAGIPHQSTVSVSVDAD